MTATQLDYPHSFRGCEYRNRQLRFTVRDIDRPSPGSGEEMQAERSLQKPVDTKGLVHAMFSADPF